MPTGQNGYNTSIFDHSFPATQFGEDVGECDFVGIKDDTDTRRKWFLASADESGANTLEAIACIPAARLKDDYEAGIRRDMRIALAFPLPAHLATLKVGDKVYLDPDPTHKGRMTLTAPTAEGQLLQVLGYGYWFGDGRRGMPTDGKANGVLVDIQPATVIPAP